MQVKLRADRLGHMAADIELLTETLLETVLATAAGMEPAVMIVDSIQTIFTADLEGAPGNVGQVRECAARLMRFAKESGTAVFVVGHVTKGGGIAGPKTLEHIVDTVSTSRGKAHSTTACCAPRRIASAAWTRRRLQDDGGRTHPDRESLRAVSRRPRSLASGSAVTALMEGTRPLLVEIRRLPRSGVRTPQRVSTGSTVGASHCCSRCSTSGRGCLGQLDVSSTRRRVRCTRGWRSAVAAALASSVYDRAASRTRAVSGRVGRAGRSARPQSERRLAEGAKMGLSIVYLADEGAEAAARCERDRRAHDQ